MRTRNIIYLCISVCLLSGCDIEDCFSTKTYDLKFGFYHLENAQEYDIRVSKIKAAESDSILVEGGVINADTLVVNPSDTSTTFDFELVSYVFDTVYSDPPDNTEILRIDTLKEDTLRRFVKFSYRKAQRIISPECGVEQAIRNLTVVDHNFDSVVVADDELDRFDDVNVEIYF